MAGQGFVPNDGKGGINVGDKEREPERDSALEQPRAEPNLPKGEHSPMSPDGVRPAARGGVGERGGWVDTGLRPRAAPEDDETT